MGGTRFVGRHIVGKALEKGHEVTLFHRGQSGPELFDGAVHRVIGDRLTDLQRLSDATFDAVIDTCAYRPSQVRAAVECLKGRVGHYVLISTISVYDGKTADQGGLNRFQPIDDDFVAIDSESYGPLKVGCEDELLGNWPDARWSIVRPTIVVGPHDHTDRFTYWLARLDAEGPVVAPNDPYAPVQFIDAADLAAFVCLCAESELFGDFDVLGPEEPMSMRKLIESAAAVCQASDKLLWVEPEDLERLGVKPWVDLPLYVGRNPEGWSLMQLHSDKARSSGLLLTPENATLQRTLGWLRHDRGKKDLAAGWSRREELETIAKLQQGA